MAWRHEEKYILDPAEAAQVMACVRRVLPTDPHYENGQYLVQSLYFDDYRYSALQEKTAGLSTHTKYRIRTYNADPSRISFEKKVKAGILTQKTGTLIDPQLCAQIALGQREVLLSENEKARMLYGEMCRNNLRGVCVVRYQRQAFIYRPLNIRVTFDTDIAYLPPDPTLLLEAQNARGVPVMTGKSTVMEVKYDSYLPLHIRTLTASRDLQTSFSKYAACMMKSGRILLND